MEYKCSRCKIVKTVENFFPSFIRNCTYCCKDCSNKAARIYYQKHPERLAYRNVKSRIALNKAIATNKRMIRDIKAATPCSDCNVFYPYYVMDFDHIDPSKKFKQVSSMHAYSSKLVLEEIAKCELVCRNCHAVRTYKRQMKDKD